MKWRKTEEPVEADVVVVDEPLAGKGRPTPKRRDVEGRRGPVSAPKSRKEAYARQKQQARTTRELSRTPAANLTRAQKVEMMRRGDPAALNRRDQGETKKLARDYVDSHRMASNYLLLLFVLMLAGTFARIAVLEIAALVIFIGLVFEWYVTGRKVRNLARERFGSADGTNLSIGWYAGSRAYIPRKWRMPAPQRELGDEL